VIAYSRLAFATVSCASISKVARRVRGFLESSTDRRPFDIPTTIASWQIETDCIGVDEGNVRTRGGSTDRTSQRQIAPDVVLATKLSPNADADEKTIGSAVGSGGRFKKETTMEKERS
jgi:hypothetical protein